ncbi:MAG: hypothetical protein AUI15_23925 [Actinobacteria bacterium 13_2_20CM_2_66_6]|nr:MAG: hypothetical protein AUI15_23925 [Actinobacteria bacterium 13_2_20CM_2_66_6]
MSPYIIAALWAVVGAAAGLGVRWGSVKLARLEGLETGSKWWQQYGPPVLCAVIFGIYGFELSSFLLLLVRSIFVLVLVQVIFFDFEHHLILGRASSSFFFRLRAQRSSRPRRLVSAMSSSPSSWDSCSGGRTHCRRFSTAFCSRRSARSCSSSRTDR